MRAAVLEMASHTAGAADARTCASPPPSDWERWDVHGCSPETNEKARVLLHKWLKHHEATSRKVQPRAPVPVLPRLPAGRWLESAPSSCFLFQARGGLKRRERQRTRRSEKEAGVRMGGLTGCRVLCFWQEISNDVGDSTYYAAMVYLVERASFHKSRAAPHADAAAGAGAHDDTRVGVQDIVGATETTVWLFFKAMTKVLELSEREQWLIALVPDLKMFVNEFKQVEVKFMFVYMLHAKLEKVQPCTFRRHGSAVCVCMYACMYVYLCIASLLPGSPPILFRACIRV